ncbi:heparinase II/III domain-containing protein [Cohnella herbarum]|uniref:Heparinase II/III-like C-terminal domain-containing protein n=1 Tax=Cohnella herbarum TaxID=2728023 RepID=A0A7Z2VJF5_9BACL|nr:heparinase II/III family protein [Cohnella herbarum]QJD83970.1 hypothetical protein HH215_12780 [Cohnella herbarum]
MLYERYGMRLKQLLLAPDLWVPIPRSADRERWEGIVPESREMWISLAERYTDYAWPAIKMEDYMAYWKVGEISKLNLALFERRSVLGILSIAEAIEGKGRFLDQVVNGIFAICEETTWVTPGHRNHWDVDKEERLPSATEHGVELFTAETSALLVWIRYLLQDRLDGISRRIGERIVAEVRNRLLTPYLEHDDYWWMGYREGVRVNNWNPWCNGAVLTGFLLLEDDPEVRRIGIAKAMSSLDAFIRTYPADGCCDEGPSYWSPSGGGLYECLELLHLASEGRIDIFDERIVRDIGAYLYKVHIHGPYFVSFADCDAKANPGGDVVIRYGRSTNDEAMEKMGLSLPSGGQPSTTIWFGIYGYLRNIFQEKKGTANRNDAPYVRDAWFPHTQVMTARERDGSEVGLYLAVKGGNNEESHNHNDVGSFIAFADGYPLFVDLGTEEYSAKTFGEQRYELWYLQSQYHNLPTVGGVLQRNGGAYRATNVIYGLTDDMAELSMEIAEAYPTEAGIDSWRRTARLIRGNDAAIEVVDAFAMRDSAANAVFHSLVTPCRPEMIGPGRIQFEYAEGRKAILIYDAEHLEARSEPIEHMESRLKRNWGDRMYRIVLEEKTEVARGERKLSIRLATD